MFKRFLLAAVGVAFLATFASAQVNRVPQQGASFLFDATTPTQTLSIGSSGQLKTSPFADTSGGASLGHLLSAATTNSTALKASAGQLYTLSATNTNAATAYLKLYDKATAPTCASDTVLATYVLLQNVPLNKNFPVGAAFAAGIGVCITAAAADNDNAAATTGITVSYSYK